MTFPIKPGCSLVHFQGVQIGEPGKADARWVTHFRGNLVDVWAFIGVVGMFMLLCSKVFILSDMDMAANTSGKNQLGI